MTDNTKTPDRWPIGYELDYANAACAAWLRDGLAGRTVLKLQSDGSGADMAEFARVDAWAHYVTTREAELEKRIAELERENAVLRKGVESMRDSDHRAVMVPSAQVAWLDAVELCRKREGE